jgi:hypothetical protein
LLDGATVEELAEWMTPPYFLPSFIVENSLVAFFCGRQSPRWSA